MKKLTKQIIATAICSTFFISSAFALETNAQPGSGSFWNKSGEGYFWYARDIDLAKKKKKKKEPKKEAVVAATAPKEAPKAPVVQPQTPPPMFSADWVKENLEVYKKYAWDNPTVENLRAYMYLQRFAIDRSEQFAYAGQMAVHGDPYLDETARAPLGGGASTIRTTHLSFEQDEALKKLFSKVGVFFVFKNNCFLCDSQAKLLKVAQNEYGTPVTAVAIDEITEISETAKLFPDYKVLPEIVDDLKVRALPASFFLNTETKEIKPLVQGMVTLQDLKRRSLDAAVKYSWLKPEDYKYVKPFEEITSLSNLLNDPKLASKITEYKEKTNPYGKDTNFVSPDVLVKEIVKAKEAQIPKNYVPRGY